VLEFAEQERTFKLGIGEWERLQEALDVGPYELFAIVKTGKWRTKHIERTLQIALEGGGTDRREARRLIDEWVRGRTDWLAHVLTTIQVLDAGLSGASDETIPKANGEGEEKAIPSPTVSSLSTSSMDGVQH
jgi:hypothetical protein